MEYNILFSKYIKCLNNFKEFNNYHSTIIITGMLHLDGFMDVCDAILSRRSKEEKLRILKDSATGAFAVIPLVILFFLQFGGYILF